MTGQSYRVPLVGIKQSMVDACREFYATIRRQQHYIAGLVSKGRPVGFVAGTWVTDCAEIKQCVILCSFCDHKVRPAHKRYGYHRDARFDRGVGGDCDGCRVHREEGLQLYVHEQYLGQGYSAR